MSGRIEIVVGREAHKKRLDEYLFDRFGGLSKMYLRHVVNEEKCEVNGRPENVGHRLRESDFIEIELDLTRETAMRPQEIPLDIVFEDDHLIVVNKPAGMLVHPTNRDKSGTLLNGLSFYLNKPISELGLRMADRAAFNENTDEDPKSQISNPESDIVRPGLIHRLDKQTSGLIVIAKNQHSHKKMTEYFRRKFVSKRYLALVDGVVLEDEGTISAPIGRFGDLKHWDVMADGKESETRFWVRRRDADKTLLELEPVTGRTNQLRIHCAHIGHPIVGDVGRGGSEHDRLCLHAWKIAFRHPSTKEQIELTCEPDDAFHHDTAVIRQSSATRS
jgi:23S rRNA pseudouridine1911/1915/1917 synthase